MFSFDSTTNKMKLKRATILTINILLSIFMSTVNCTDTAYITDKKSSLFFLENETEFVKMFAIANMLHYFSKDTLKTIQHPLKDKLEAFFKGITGKFEDESEFIEESYKFFDYLKQLKHSFSPYSHELVSLLLKIQENLVGSLLPVNSIDPQQYYSHPFLCENFSLKTVFSPNQVSKYTLLIQNNLKKPTLLKPKNVSLSFFEVNGLVEIDFSPYFYGYTDAYDKLHIDKINLNEEDVYEYFDDFKFAYYKLKAFINEINKKYYFFVKEKGKWRAFINNREVFGFSMDTNCPIIFVLEKISEVNKK
ncbi:hypothetical protein TUBRATIS_16350 [Tubulinosema ratisbonensis]|uniref:Uncharacterized protein n=1 Tax=Tubulinosema ratisbonensis TaxID=291195 RepID=A0A437AL09_9MICR|nr:hypothetical protein TUBRATIS_16350 [Tubulinosema ratisbonensis]